MPSPPHDRGAGAARPRSALNEFRTGVQHQRGPAGPFPKAPASVSQGPPASVTSQNREEGGTCARTRETAQPRRRQGIVAGHGTKVRGWDRICREAGTRGVWGDRPGSCQEAAGERPARGLPAQSACTERGVRSEGPGIQELEGGGCQGTNRAIARCGGRGWRPSVKVAARRPSVTEGRIAQKTASRVPEA